jgi:hypothetical protein
MPKKKRQHAIGRLLTKVKNVLTLLPRTPTKDKPCP